jgi:hypothetical protein
MCCQNRTAVIHRIRSYCSPAPPARWNLEAAQPFEIAPQPCLSYFILKMIAGRARAPVPDILNSFFPRTAQNAPTL